MRRPGAGAATRAGRAAAAAEAAGRVETEAPRRVVVRADTAAAPAVGKALTKAAPRHAMVGVDETNEQGGQRRKKGMEILRGGESGNEQRRERSVESQMGTGDADADATAARQEPKAAASALRASRRRGP